MVTALSLPTTFQTINAGMDKAIRLSQSIRTKENVRKEINRALVNQENGRRFAPTTHERVFGIHQIKSP